MTRSADEVRALIVAVLGEVASVDTAGLGADDDLFEVGIDSLDFTTVIVEVEERLGEDLPADAFDRFAELEVFTLNTVAEAISGHAPS